MHIFVSKIRKQKENSLQNKKENIHICIKLTYMKSSDMKSILFQCSLVLHHNSFTLILCPVTSETVTEWCECISSLFVSWKPHAISAIWQRPQKRYRVDEQKYTDTQRFGAASSGNKINNLWLSSQGKGQRRIESIKSVVAQTRLTGNNVFGISLHTTTEETIRQQYQSKQKKELFQSVHICSVNIFEVKMQINSKRK